MDVSFIIPARNEQDTLRYTVANLYKTVTHHSFEIIIVDDNSDLDLCSHLDPSLPVVYLRNSERLGTAKSRNIGARRASGELLVFLDAHVCFPAGWLEAMCRETALLANGLLAPAMFNVVDLAQFRALATDLEVPWALRLLAVPGVFKRIAYGYFKTPLPTPQTLPILKKKLPTAFTVPIVGSGSLCVRREFFFRVGCFEEELSGFGGYEDEELCMRCWVLGYWVAVLPSVRYFHFKARPSHPSDYRLKPFHRAYYDASVENALRVYYLHLPDDVFQQLLDVYKEHPGFTPDVNALLTDRLKQRKAWITAKRIHDHRWLLRRVSRV